MSDIDRQDCPSNVVTRLASEHLAQEPAPAGSMLVRYALTVLTVLVLVASIRPALAVFMAVAGVGGR